jgi:hypothetical protein
VNAKCEFKWDGTNELVQIHPVVLWWMAAHWHVKVVLEGHLGQSSIAKLNADTKAPAMSVFIEHIPTTKELESGTIGQW